MASDASKNDARLNFRLPVELEETIEPKLDRVWPAKTLSGLREMPIGGVTAKPRVLIKIRRIAIAIPRMTRMKAKITARSRR